MLYCAELKEQAIRQSRTDARQTLKHVDLSRLEALRFSVVPLENTGLGSAQLMGETTKDVERVLRIAGVNYW